MSAVLVVAALGLVAILGCAVAAVVTGWGRS